MGRKDHAPGSFGRGPSSGKRRTRLSSPGLSLRSRRAWLSRRPRASPRGAPRRSHQRRRHLLGASRSSGGRCSTAISAPLFAIKHQQKDLAIRPEGGAGEWSPPSGAALVHQLLSALEAKGEARRGRRPSLTLYEELSRQSELAPAPRGFGPRIRAQTQRWRSHEALLAPLLRRALLLSPSVLGADSGDRKTYVKSHPFGPDRESKVGIRQGPVTVESVRIRNWPDADDFDDAEKDQNETSTMVVEFEYSNRDEVRDWKCRYTVTIEGKDGTLWAENDRTANLDAGKIGDTNKMFVKMKNPLLQASPHVSGPLRDLARVVRRRRPASAAAGRVREEELLRPEDRKEGLDRLLCPSFAPAGSRVTNGTAHSSSVARRSASMSCWNARSVSRTPSKLGSPTIGTRKRES